MVLFPRLVKTHPDKRRSKTLTAPESLISRRIAGHSSITITQRYVHPQADAVERAFASWGQIAITAQSENRQVGTNLGTIENGQSDCALQAFGAKGGTRTPTVLPARS